MKPALFCLLPLAALAGAASPPALAQGLADLAAIDLAVARFTGHETGTLGGAGGPVDRRLRLAPCGAELVLGWYGTRQSSVEVTCPGRGGWKLYVPVLGQAADIAAPAIVRGDAVTISVPGDGFAVSQPGEALEGGAPGAWIKVRGLAPGAQALRAQVVRPGLVAIPLGSSLP